jgi:hypothetical protein
VVTEPPEIAVGQRILGRKQKRKGRLVTVLSGTLLPEHSSVKPEPHTSEPREEGAGVGVKRLEGAGQSRIGWELISQDHAIDRAAGATPWSVAISQHRPEESIKPQPSAVGPEGVECQGTIVGVRVLDLNSLTLSSDIGRSEVVEPIVNEELFVATRLGDVPQEDVHETTCDQEVLIFVASVRRRESG